MINIFKQAILLLFLIFIPISSEIINLRGIAPFGNKELLEKEYKRLYSVLDINNKIDTSNLIITYYNSKTMDSGILSLPEWGGGGAIGKNQIIIPINKKPLYRSNSAVTLSHELAHIVISRICDSVKVPRFFHEGIAMHLSGDISFEEQGALSKALFTNSLMPLTSIDSVNSFSHNRAQLAYAQSRLTVDYLIKNYDREILPLLLISTKKSGDFEKGLLEELDITVNQLDSLSRLHIAQTYSNIFWILDHYIIWISILLLFLTAYILTLIRNRKKMKAMEEAERLEEEIDDSSIVP